MNISETAEAPMAHQIRLIFLPVLMAFGIPGNIVSIIILYRLRNCQRSTYLVCLAVADLVVLCGSEPLDWIGTLFKIRLLEINGVFCKILTLAYSFSLYVSAWILVLVTAERVCSVIYPHKVRTLFSPFRAILSVVLIVVCAFCLNIHFLTRPEITTTEQYCFTRGTFDHFYFRIWPWIEVIVGFCLPCAFLIFGNCLIVYRLRRQNTYGMPSETQATATGVRKLRVSIVTKRVIIVNLVYIVCILPICIYENVLLYFRDPLRHSEVVSTTLMMIMLVNNSVNFFLYILIGFRFRCELVKLMSVRKSLCFRSKKRKARSADVNGYTFKGRIFTTFSLPPFSLGFHS